MWMFKSESEIKDPFSAQDLQTQKTVIQDLGAALLTKLYFHHVEW